MGVIKNLPAIISLLAGLIICFVGLVQQMTFRTLCVNVSIVMIIFYMLGMIIQKIIIDIIADVIINKKKKEYERKLEMAQKAKQKEQRQREAQYSSKQVDRDSKEEHDEGEEEFSPLTVRRVKSKEATMKSE